MSRSSRGPFRRRVHLYCIEHTEQVDFLSQLPHLAVLTLNCRPRGDWIVPADAVLASLVRCSGITELDLHCGFTSAHWSALLAKLTKLKRLTICGGDIETLQFFAAGPITELLEELRLLGHRLPPAELPHLYGLRRLRAIHLDRCFSSQLSDGTVDSLFPPTPILPALTSLYLRWCEADSNWSDRVRTAAGPSFEWMQERVKQ